MYHAIVWTLMWLVLIFSGIWSYVKMLLLLLSFIVPQVHLLLQRRERLLIWLDALGKYSLVDSFVLVLMLVSFRFHIDVPGLGAIDSYVIPEFGFYMNAAAQTHRLSGARESLSSHVYSLRHAGGDSTRLTPAFHCSYLAITLCATVLMLIGVNAKCFVFNFRGLAGLALGDDSVTKHSLISLGVNIPASVTDPTAACSAAVVALYFVPLLLSSRRQARACACSANSTNPNPRDVFRPRRRVRCRSRGRCRPTLRLQLRTLRHHPLPHPLRHQIPQPPIPTTPTLVQHDPHILRLKRRTAPII